jgi:hypothetical protein
MKRSTFKRHGAVPTWKRPRKPKPIVPKALGKSSVSKLPWESPAYRAHVRASFPCLRCQKPAEHAHHIRECFPRTMGRRISDKYVVPLCQRCHTELHARSSTFWTDRHIQPAALLTWCESVHSNWSSRQ